MNVYAVTIPKMLCLPDGTKKQAGSSTMWVGSEERARQLCEEDPRRTWRLVTDHTEVPPQALDKLAAAAAERAAAAATAN
jgi:hypothetical protein